MALANGDSASVTRTFTLADRERYRTLAAETGRDQDDRGHRVPGPLIAGLFSYLLGTELPGRGTNYLKQSLRYPQPAHYGDTLTATVRVARLRPDKALVNLETVCTTADGRVVCEGEALVLAKDTGHFGRPPQSA